MGTAGTTPRAARWKWVEETITDRGTTPSAMAVWAPYTSARNASSARTRAQLGWTPTQPGLLADLDQPHYFKA